MGRLMWSEYLLMMPLTFQALGVVHGVFAQVQDDAGAARGAGDGLDLKVAGAAADPAHALSGLACRRGGIRP